VPVDHDAPGHVQSKAGAFPDRFGGEEGFEDLLVHAVRNAGAGVSDLDEQFRSTAPSEVISTGTSSAAAPAASSNRRPSGSSTLYHR